MFDNQQIRHYTNNCKETKQQRIKKRGITMKAVKSIVETIRETAELIDIVVYGR